MSDLQNMFGGNKGLALAGYNWGEANVQRWLRNGANPANLPRETANYVRSITGHDLNEWVQNPGIPIHTVPMTPGQISPGTVTTASLPPPGVANASGGGGGSGGIAAGAGGVGGGLGSAPPSIRHAGSRRLERSNASVSTIHSAGEHWRGWRFWCSAGSGQDRVGCGSRPNQPGDAVDL